MTVRSVKLVFIPLLLFLLSACSLDRFVIRQTATLLDYGVIALYEEGDLQIARTALESNIKLLEGMIKGDPDNRELRLLTSQQFQRAATSGRVGCRAEEKNVFFGRLLAFLSDREQTRMLGR